MIPKIIHYVWFSDPMDNPPEYPEDVIKLYEIMERKDA